MLDFLESSEHSEHGRLDHFDLAAAESLAVSSLRAMLQASAYKSPQGPDTSISMYVAYNVYL